MSASLIEWTEETWNPLTGCTKISAGCQHCYAERMAKRLQAMGLDHYRAGFELAVHPEKLNIPRRWKRPRMVFVNSMSDLFHDRVSDEFIRDVFRVMNETPWHTYQVLTKRAQRLWSLSRGLTWTPNIWMGVSVESHSWRSRIRLLSDVAAAVRFLSCEPLLGPLPDMALQGIHWVIVGGESGPGARPMHPDWAESLLYQCRGAGVPFFMKQLGGHPDKRGQIEQLPAHLRVRMFPGDTWTETVEPCQP
ncbi:MAG: phage Gp37/Gp68 family protein [Deltaproteobacteria bacterium]|nr:phage Gp37/Gp68 family protein [Deltaproteobacteria bacterium]